MKIFKEIREQYVYLWWWLLEQGILISTILVNFTLATIFAIAMFMLHFFLKFWGKQ